MMKKPEDMTFDDILEFQKKLEEKYPKMFTPHYGGLEINSGWLQLIETLCDLIQRHIDWKNRDSEQVQQVTIDQIKEKFGSLRFYYTGGDDVVDGLVRMAEAMSGHMCDKCGSPGKLVLGSWLVTRCEKHE